METNMLFGNFEGEGFEGESFDGFKRRRGKTNKSYVGGRGTEAQINIVVTSNVTGEAPKIQLFGGNRPVWEVYNPQLFNVNAKQPSAVFVSDLADINGTSPGNAVRANRIYRTSGVETSISGLSTAGAVRIYGTTNTEYVEVNCSDVPYISLCRANMVVPFEIRKMRISVNTIGGTAIADSGLTAQFDYDLTIVQNTTFGNDNVARISPRAFFNPNQQQRNIVDVDQAFEVDFEKAINTQLIQVASGQAVKVTYSLFISNWDKVTSAI